MGTVVGDRAERVLHNTAERLPRFSVKEMGEVMTKKHTLLSELSQSYMIIGQAEVSLNHNLLDTR
jgi:hypothetical protein